MRIAWVVPDRLDQVTGGYLYDARVVRHLQERGHEVQVIELQQRRASVDPFASWALVKALVGQPYEAVVIDELAYPAMVFGLPWALLSLALQRPLIVALVHHLRSTEPGPRFRQRLFALIERRAFAALDLAVCTSRTTSGALGALLPPNCPVAVVAPGRDLHVALTAARGGETPLRVITVGHWTPRKGIVEALRVIGRTTSDVELDLVGDPTRDPSYSAKVRAELRRPELTGRVRVHGLVSSAELSRLYGQADVLLQTSTYEGYGMVIGEALNAGLPVVATRVGAVPEVARDGYEAVLAPAGNLDELAQALTRLGLDPAERARRATWARDRAHSLPTWRQSCQAFELLLGREIRKHRLARDPARLTPDNGTQHEGIGAAGL